jgi:glycosyltransferase involved in cell wall biosynthesis
MISCLCVTRGDRPGLLSEAVADFVRQTFQDRELVILHDGDDSVHAGVGAIVAAHPGASIRIERAPAGSRLGGLRNIAMARAGGEWICQWDDDDRYHPERLQLQWSHAQSDGAAVNYLVDQLHWFGPDNLLCWDDWGGEPYPTNVIQGTILARRAVMPPYPDIDRGEDTLQTHALLRGGGVEGLSGFAPQRHGLVLHLPVPWRQCMGRGASPRDFRGQTHGSGPPLTASGPVKGPRGGISA